MGFHLSKQTVVRAIRTASKMRRESSVDAGSSPAVTNVSMKASRSVTSDSKMLLKLITDRREIASEKWTSVLQCP